MPNKIRIFVASPSDVAIERAKVDKVVETLKPTADHLDLILEVVKWENAVPDMGRAQQVIFDQLQPTEWDLFIGILWHRFGTPSGGEDAEGNDFKSGTEEEFHAAYQLWKKHDRPRMMVYRCKRDLPMDKIDIKQYQRVDKFFSEFNATKGEHPGLYMEFKSAEDFERKLTRDLQEVFIGYGKKEGKETVLPPPPKDTPPNHLPRRQDFFGRKNDMKRVLGALDPKERTWGVVIDGIGGIGKTALAVEAAHRAKDEGLFKSFLFITAKDRHLSVTGIIDKTPTALSLDDFLNQTARQMGEVGIAKMESSQKAEALHQALQKASTLLVYDNLETLPAEDQEALAEFLRYLPEGSKAMLTSRRRGGEGALWLRLDKLSWDAACAIIENKAKQDENLRKKLDKTGENLWKELYKESNGSPLALNHILGLMRLRRTLSVKGALELLRGGSGNEDILKFVFREAEKELDESDNAALTALALFEPSAPYDALQEVSALSRNALNMSLDRLDALSLLADAGEDRYALHPLTSRYAKEFLEEADEIKQRFAAYWLSYAERYGGSSHNYATFPKLDAEWKNLQKTLDNYWEQTAFNGEAVGNSNALRFINRLLDALRVYFYYSRWDELIQWSTRAYEALHATGDWRNAGEWAFDVAWVYVNRVETKSADRWAERCATAWEQAGIKKAKAAHLRGLIAKLKGWYDPAESFYQRALATYQKANDDENISIILYELGNLEQERENYPAAEKHLLQSLVLAKKVKRVDGQASILNKLSRLAIKRGNWKSAREWVEKSSPLAELTGMQDEIALNKYHMMKIHEYDGNLVLALSLAREALVAFERLRISDEDLEETRELIVRLEGKLK
jgi:hypothetical protein